VTASPIDFDAALNPDQLAAVTHGDGPQLVLAGAGSGKTRVITYRVAWLVRERGVEASAITAVTFTNKAAGEMKGRVEELLGLYPLPSFVGTFHRFALRLLRAYGERVDLPREFAILDSGDQAVLIKKAIEAEGLPERNFTPQVVLAAISGAKNRLLGPSAYERQAQDFFSRRVAPLYRRYQELVRAAGGVDFDDMIRLAVELLRGQSDVRERVRGRIRYLHVDELQDTNHAQLALIREISGGTEILGGNVTAVGDEDQSIYRWRGADIANILEFEKSFPGAEVRKLERNYRSTQNILDASGAVVAHNVGRRGKKLWTDAGAGEKLHLYRARDELDEARWTVSTLQELEHRMPLGEMAVLVRTNAQTRALEEELLRRKVPYALIGGMRFYERAEVKDLVAYLRLVRNPRDAHSLNRIVNQPPRGIGRSTHQALVNRAAERGKTTWDVLVDDDLAGFPIRGATSLLKFRDLIASLAGEAADLPLPALLRRVIEVTSYTDLYQNDEDRSKLENVGELVSAAQEFVEANAYAGVEDDLLTAFLDHAALTSEADAEAGGRISLMTLHSAKGLEFRAVVLPGLEEELLPHVNAGVEQEDVEEERRLLYVGMTRAKERLYLAASRRRRRGGLYQDQRESRFLGEIPVGLLDVETSPELVDRHASTSAVHAFFGRPSPAGSAAASRRGVPRVFDDAGPELAIKRGNRVRHAVLGEGRVLQIEGSGEDARLVVFFDGVGRRKLLVKYAQLEVV
jgi:DNA helicase-2/ATP-dependent DNA helicase PcrA